MLDLILITTNTYETNNNSKMALYLHNFLVITNFGLPNQHKVFSNDIHYLGIRWRKLCHAHKTLKFTCIANKFFVLQSC